MKLTENYGKMGEFSNNLVMLFSGGMDSTISLLHAVDLKRKSKPDLNINTVYFYSEVILEKKRESELIARKNIIQMIKDKYDIEIHDHVVKIEYSEDQWKLRSKFMDSANRRRHMLPQPGLWISYLFEIMTGFDEKVEVHYSVLSTDQCSNTIHDLENIFYSYCSILEIDAKLMYPVGPYSKLDIIREYMHQDECRDFLKECWVCECPSEIGEPCNSCVPCTTLRTNLLGELNIVKTTEELMDMVMEKWTKSTGVHYKYDVNIIESSIPKKITVEESEQITVDEKLSEQVEETISEDEHVEE